MASGRNYPQAASRVLLGFERRIDLGPPSRLTEGMKLLPLSAILAAAITVGCATEKQPAAVYQPIPAADNALPGVHPLPPAEAVATPPPPRQPSVQQTTDADKMAAREEEKRREQEQERQKQEKVIVSTDTGLQGRVATYNEDGHFVVLIIPADQMPKADTELFLYRDNMKVGEVKITGPFQDSNVVGDLVNGDAQPGDEVRDK